MGCWKCQEKYIGWADPQPVIYVGPADKREYCVFHAPKDEKRKELGSEERYTVKEFNELVFARIGAAKERVKAEKDGWCDLRWTVFPGSIVIGSSVRESNSLPPIDFSGAIFWGPVDFQRTIFRGPAWFYDATFHHEALFLGAQFIGPVGFYKATFHAGAEFRQANFHNDAGYDKAVFRAAVSFHRARFDGKTVFIHAAIPLADFRQAVLRKVFFTSKTVLNTLRYPLSQDQLLACVFVSDEEERKRFEQERSGSSREQSSLTALEVKFSTYDWTPYDISMLYMSLQITANRIQYLTTTHDTSISEIERMLNGYCLQPDLDSITISTLHIATPQRLKLYYRKALTQGRDSGIILKAIAVAVPLALGVGQTLESLSAAEKNHAEAWKCATEVRESEARTANLAADTELKRLQLQREQDELRRKQNLEDNAGNLPAVQHTSPPDWGAAQKTSREDVARHISVPVCPNPGNPVVSANLDTLYPIAVETFVPTARWLERKGITLTVKEHTEAKK